VEGILMDLAAISKFIKQQGFATLAAVGLAYFVYHQFNVNKEDRDTWTAIVIDQISDLREKTATMEKACVDHERQKP
jgi:hypothetical protein